MRIIIAGCRDFTDYELLQREVSRIIIAALGSDNITIISGHARGADALGERFAKERNYSVCLFPANWELYGKRAGPLRNEEMAKYAAQDNGVLIAFCDGCSRGTKNMINNAYNYKLKTYIVRY